MCRIPAASPYHIVYMCVSVMWKQVLMIVVFRFFFGSCWIQIAFIAVFSLLIFYIYMKLVVFFLCGCSYIPITIKMHIWETDNIYIFEFNQTKTMKCEYHIYIYVYRYSRVHKLHTRNFFGFFIVHERNVAQLHYNIFVDIMIYYSEVTCTLYNVHKRNLCVRAQPTTIYRYTIKTKRGFKNNAILHFDCTAKGFDDLDLRNVYVFFNWRPQKTLLCIYTCVTTAII